MVTSHSHEPRSVRLRGASEFMPIRRGLGYCRWQHQSAQVAFSADMEPAFHHPPLARILVDYPKPGFSESSNASGYRPSAAPADCARTDAVANVVAVKIVLLSELDGASPDCACARCGRFTWDAASASTAVRKKSRRFKLFVGGSSCRQWIPISLSQARLRLIHHQT
jgi:hypothetical protein